MGKSMKKIIHNRPCLGNEEYKAVKRVLARNWLIEGREVESFQNSMRALVRTKYAAAVNSGLSALHLSLIALGVQKNDEVIIPSYTCVALLHAINYVGARPVIVDIEDRGFNIDPFLVKKKLTRKTKAIIVPHMFGFSASIDKIKRFSIPVIEDCALALGSSYKGKHVGYAGDISIFSFYATKMIATGQGGMIVTNYKNYYEKVFDLIHHSQRKNYKTRYNYYLTDIAASLGSVQLKKLQSFIARRKEIGRGYQHVLDEKTTVEYFPKRVDKEANYYRFVLVFKNKELRDKIQQGLEKRKILTIPPIRNFELLHNLMRLDKSSYPNSEKRSETTLSIPIYPCLTNKEVRRIAYALGALLK